jgi:hypothetical protein
MNGRFGAADVPQSRCARFGPHALSKFAAAGARVRSHQATVSDHASSVIRTDLRPRLESHSKRVPIGKVVPAHPRMHRAWRIETSIDRTDRSITP